VIVIVIVVVVVMRSSTIAADHQASITSVLPSSWSHTCGPPSPPSLSLS
jgi:hypothetical protein